jgi:hypothetical protein
MDAGDAVPVNVRPGSDVAGATADTGGRLIVRPSEVGAAANYAFTAPVAVLTIACPVRSGSRPRPGVATHPDRRTRSTASIAAPTQAATESAPYQKKPPVHRAGEEFVCLSASSGRCFVSKPSTSTTSRTNVTRSRRLSRPRGYPPSSGLSGAGRCLTADRAADPYRWSYRASMTRRMSLW